MRSGLARVQVRQALAQGEQFRLVQHGFQAGEDPVFFEPHVVVEQPAQSCEFQIHRALVLQSFLEFPNLRSYGRVVGEHAHDIGVFIEPGVAGVEWQQDLLLFAKVILPRMLPELKEFPGGALDGSGALGGQRLIGPPNLQSLDQGVMVVLAQSA